MGRLVAPELRVRDRQLKARALSGDPLDFRFNRDGRLYFDHSRINAHGGDLHTLGTQAALFADVQPYGAINAGAGIPAGVGELGVVRNHRQRVRPTVNEVFQLHKEAGITVVMEAELFAVEADGRVFVHALELHEDRFAFPLRRSSEGLFVSVEAAREIAVAAVGDVLAALLADLRVVRQGDGLAVAGPVVVKDDGDHLFSSL